MDDALHARIRSAYEGETGRRWERVERGRPASYVERNAAIGSRRLHEQVRERLGPVRGLRVLDAGCGLGTLARALAREGASVTGVDLVPRFVAAARAAAGRDNAAPLAPAVSADTGAARFIEGSFLDPLRPDGVGERFDVLLLLRVIEDYTSTERLDLLRAALDAGIPRVLLAFRHAAPGGGSLWDLVPGAAEPEVDDVALLRWVHRRTLYRQTRRDVIRVRNYRVYLSALEREDSRGRPAHAPRGRDPAIHER